ncbi:hypothetical protein ALC152_01480 [Arcobacter sp. 15-2]|uniref:hypothetical protein n=1 Tax=Arcobacter sp. 15-2 TaxID=3374109 RepID=UPI00399CB8D2
MINFIKKLFQNNNSTTNKHINVDKSISDKNDKIQSLLTDAVQLKKEKRFDEACTLLKESYKLAGDDLSIVARLRLPMYLQLANKNDEGWSDITNLNVLYLDAYSQMCINKQMRIFLSKEKKFMNAIPFGIYSYCKEIEYNLDMFDKKQEEIKSDDYKDIIENMDKETLKGFDGTYFFERASQLREYDSISIMISPLLKKAKLDGRTKNFTDLIYNYIFESRRFNYLDVDKICKSNLL